MRDRVYILLSDDKHRFVRDTSKNALEIRDKIQSKTIFFYDKIFSRTGLCHTLNFVSDYIPQLYFECNHLI